MTTYLVFDTETTDLVGIDLKPLAKQPRIVEFAGILVRITPDGQCEELDRMDLLLNPQMPIPEAASKIHHIKDEDVADKPTFAEKAEEIETLFLSADGFVGHNLTFDLKIVRNEFRRLNPVWDFELGQKKICTVESTEHFLGRRLSLADLHQHLFGFGFTGAHRAMQDVEATLRCFVDMVRSNNRGR